MTIVRRGLVGMTLAMELSKGQSPPNSKVAQMLVLIFKGFIEIFRRWQWYNFGDIPKPTTSGRDILSGLHHDIFRWNLSTPVYPALGAFNRECLHPNGNSTLLELLRDIDLIIFGSMDAVNRLSKQFQV